MLTKKRFIALNSQFYDAYHQPSRWNSRGISHRKHSFGDTESYEMHSMAFYQHLHDNNSSVINKINSFLTVMEKLDVWQALMERNSDEQEQFHIIFEEIMPLFQLAMDYPYATKSILVYSCIDLFCLASRVFNEAIPKFDKYQLKIKTLDIFRCLALKRGWKAFEDLYDSLGEIDADPFRIQSSYFRIRTHHRIQPQVEIGEKLLLSHWESKNAAGYTIGSESALPLKKAIPLLAREHEKCLKAYRKFWRFLNEMHRDVERANTDLAKTLSKAESS